MLRTIQGREFDFNCKLGATVRIKSKFRKTYNQVVEELDKLDTEGMIALLYCGLSPEQITESEFTAHIFETCGLGDLTDELTWFVKQIQYPGLTEDEIEKKLSEKRAQIQKYQTQND